MNKAIKEAMEIMEGVYVQDLPQVKIGEEVALKEIWDGEGEVPEESCSYQIAEIEWINYEFETVEKSDKTLETVVKITDIELL